MATYQVSDSFPPFEYGSAVQWRLAGSLLRGSICGFSFAETPERAAELGVPLGTVVALIEEGSGAAIEVPIDQLELI